MLNQAAVVELQQILAEEYDKKLELKEVKKIGSRLVLLYKEILASQIKINNHATQESQPTRRP